MRRLPPGTASERPHVPWVLHSTTLLGNLTDRWIALQSAPSPRYDARLLGRAVAPDQDREPTWVAPSDRPDLWLAQRALFKTAGLTGGFLARPFRDSPPSVVHVHYGPLAACQRRLAARLDAPLVASFYGYDATERRYVEGRRWGRRYRHLFDAVRAVIAEGPAMAGRVQALGCPTEKLHVVRMPADAEALQHCEAPKADGFLCCLAGRFIEKKGFDVGIRAFARALGDRPDARLLIIGGGELEGELRRAVADAGIEDQVRWGGRMPFDRFMTEIARAHICLYPSRTAANGDSEGGAPVTLIEAQWLGVPSLVSSHDDLPFVVPPDGAVVLDPMDVEGWADVLRELYRAPGRVVEMGSAARRFAHAHHSPEENVRQREAVYDAVTGRRGERDVSAPSTADGRPTARTA